MRKAAPSRIARVSSGWAVRLPRFSPNEPGTERKRHR
jgi:hypothetical protein